MMQKIILFILLLASNSLFGQNVADSLLPYKRPFKQGYFSNVTSPYRIRSGTPIDGVFVNSIHSKDSVFNLEKGRIVAMHYLGGAFIVIIQSSRNYVSYISDNASDTSGLRVDAQIEKGAYLFSAEAGIVRGYQLQLMISDKDKLLSYDDHLKFLKHR